MVLDFLGHRGRHIVDYDVILQFLGQGALGGRHLLGAEGLRYRPAKPAQPR